MSNWPPQQPPPAAPQSIQQFPAQRAGCGRAIGVTFVLIVLSILLVRLLGGKDGYMPIIGESVAVVRIEGAIMESEETVKLIRRLRKNDLIKAMVLRLETPGGGVAASEEIYREVLKIRSENKKPVIVSMGGVAASGGYYIAAASDHIFATSGTITGSIGVVSPMFNLQETMRKLGIREDAIVTGEHKNAGSPFSRVSPAERALIQGVINDMYRQFFQVVLQSRHEAIAKAVATGDIEQVLNPAETKLPGAATEWTTFTTGTIAQALGVPVETENALRRLADGRIYTGEQGLRVGLVDSIGTLQDAVDYAGIKADLGTDPTVVDRTPGSDVPSWLGAKVRSFLRETVQPQESLQLRSPY